MKRLQVLFLPAFALLCCQGLSQGSHTVTLISNQPPELFAHAGNDTTLYSSGTLLLGGLPAATGGTPPYTFLWVPGEAEDLDDSTLANPTYTHHGFFYSVQFHLLVTDSRSCRANDSVTVILAYHSIDEPSQSPMRIYPVPATSYLTIELPVPQGVLLITSIEGKVLQQVRVADKLNHLALEHLPRGIYLLTWQQGDINQTVRIVLR